MVYLPRYHQASWRHDQGPGRSHSTAWWNSLRLRRPSSSAFFPRKGTIAVGSDADIVLFDNGERHVISAETQHSNWDFTLFEGYEVTGKIKKVFLRGELIVNGEQWLGKAGCGQFVSRGQSGGW